MPAPRKYPEELKERAIRLCLDALKDPERSKGCFRRIGEELNVNGGTLRGWVRQAQIDQGARAGTTTSDSERIRHLEAENRELRRANAILKSASAFSRRSSTAPLADLPVHRLLQGAVRGRADLQGPDQLRPARRPVRLLRRPQPSALAQGRVGRGGR